MNGPHIADDLKRHRLQPSTARDLRSSGYEGAGSVLLTPEDDAVGVLLTVEEYQLLRAAADLAAQPGELFQLLRENRRFQRGDERDLITENELEDVLGV